MVAIILGSIASAWIGYWSLRKYDMVAVAVVSGAALSYWASGYIAAGVAWTGLGGVGAYFGYPGAEAGFGYFLAFAIYFGQIFPVAFRYTSKLEPLALNIHARLTELWREVYSEDKSAFRDVVMQLTNIFVTLVVAYFTFTLLPSFGFSPIAAVTVAGTATFVAALGSYWLIGQLLMAGGSGVAAFGFSSALAAYTLKLYPAYLGWFGFGGTITAAAIVWLFSMGIGYPELYKGAHALGRKGARAVGGERALKVRNGLVKAHKWVSDQVENSLERTYGKKDDNVLLLLHVENILFALSWLGWTHVINGFVGVRSIIAFVLSVIPAMISYTFVGKWILKARNGLVGPVLSLICGMSTYYTLAGFDYNNTATAVGVGAALVMGIVLYPLVFSGFYGLSEVTHAPASILPKLQAWHDACWKLCVDIWNRIKDRVKKTLDAWGNLLGDVYVKDHSVFRDVMMQIVNIVTTVATLVALPFILHGWGFTGWVGITLIGVLTALVTLSAYCLVGSLLMFVGNFPVAMAISVGVYPVTVAILRALGADAVVNVQYVGVALAALNLLLVYPLLFKAVRHLVGTAGEKTRERLVGFHKKTCQKVVNSFEDTYLKFDEKTAVYLQLFNILVALAVLVWTYELARLAGFGIGGRLVFTGLALAPAYCSYVLIGRALMVEKAGNWIAGFILSINIGLLMGEYVHSTLGVSLGYATLTGIGSMFVVFGVLNPITYVSIAAAIEATGAKKMLPTLQAWHKVGWQRFLVMWRKVATRMAQFWAFCRAKYAVVAALCARAYAAIDAALRPIVEEARRKFNEAWARAAARFQRFRK
jgi:hypothetical protein